MKIAHLYYSLNYGGIETLLINIANWQSRNGNDVSIILINKTKESDLINLLDKRVNLISLDKKSKFGFIKAIIKLNIILCKNKYDILHIHAAEIANTVKGFIKAKKILHVHATTEITNTKIPKCDGCIAISHSVKNILLNKYNIESTVIFNGVDFSRFKQKESNDISNKIIAIGALNIKIKNQDGLIHEFHKVRKIIKANLYIVGSGPDNQILQNLINRLKLNQRVFLLGNKSQNWIQNNLKSYDLFVQASHHEGLGIAAIEASASLVPLLLSNTEGHNEISMNGKLCDLFDNDKNNELGNKIANFYTNPLLFFNKARKSYTIQKKRFDFDLYNKKLIDFYHS